MADEDVHTDGSPAPPPGEPVHLPGPTYLPVVTALGLTLAVCGVVLSTVMTGIGLVITVIAIWRWIRDTRQDISDLPLEH
jgi:hypothetical protein